MSSSTEIISGGIATYVVKVGGSAIPDESRILSIQIDKWVNRIPIALVRLLDGNVEDGTFEASSSSTFLPGNKITIEAGYDNSNQVIFEGIITKQQIQIDDLNGSVLIVECRDEAIKMVVGRKSLTYSKKKDSDIISGIIGTYSGLTADVTSTSVEWPEQVQFYATDWDFVLTRAEANGLIVNVLNAKVSVVKPDADSSSVLTVEYGDNMYAFNADLNAISQINSVKASTWDYKTQQIIDASTNTSSTGAGNLSSKKLSEVVGLSDFELQTTANLTNDELTNWTNAQHVKSDYSKIQGTAKIQGSPKVNPGAYITLAGVGDRINGDHFVSAVSHDISDGNWMTDLSIGMSDKWFAEEPDVVAPSASGLLPGIKGLMNATVKQMYNDPDSQYRILLDLPMFDPSGEGVWARLANFYSTSGAGAFFLPEVGDEVIVGFLNEDPRFPVILGSLYSSSSNKPFDGLDPAENNPKKAIVSKSGINITFDDENVIFKIETPGKNTITISDQDKEISIKDENNNSIVMSSSGIVISSEKDIEIKADGNLKLSGAQGVSITSDGGDIENKGLNIKSQADMEYSAEGSMTASVQGGTELTLKGAMVMIN